MNRSNSSVPGALFFFLLMAADAVVWYSILLPGTASSLELSFLDVGQGDASLVRFPGGVDVLIDGGRDANVLQSLSKVLPQNDRYIDLVVMTHPQLDHFGGLIDVVKNYDVGMFVESGRKGEIDAYRELEDVLHEAGVPRIALGEGDRIVYADSVVQVLGPSPKNIRSKELNDTSLVIMLTRGNFKALYTGDIGFKTEDELIRSYDLNADVLKVPHHGSKFSSGKQFLAEVSPLVAAIEVGKNSYGHPTKETLGRLDAAHARMFRGDVDGVVKVIVREESIDVFTENAAQ